MPFTVTIGSWTRQLSPVEGWVWRETSEHFATREEAEAFIARIKERQAQAAAIPSYTRMNALEYSLTERVPV